MAMKIYKVVSDHAYWRVMAAKPDFWKECLKTYKDLFSGRPMANGWRAPCFYAKDPVQTTKGSFHYLVSGTLVYSDEVYDSNLGECIERSGEIFRLNSMAQANLVTFSTAPLFIIVWTEKILFFVWLRMVKLRSK